MSQRIPNLVTLQGQLFDAVHTAGVECGVTVILQNYRDSPRIGLRVAARQATLTLLEACYQAKLKISDPQTRKELTLEMLRSRQYCHLCIWQPIIVDGRMIHGPLSGIDLIISQCTDTVEDVTFPCPVFADLWLNKYLAGQTRAVETALLTRLSTTRQPKKVDIVFTWVDDKDPAWQEKYAQHHPGFVTKDATDSARFANHDELLYALRGVLRYFDGIGSIYLVTDDQTPSFWDEFADRVKIIDHAQIMPTDVVRPTFNSHVIESCLHKIPELAGQYLYFNDDVILTNPVGVSDFFDDDGRAKVFFSDKTFIPKGQRTSDMLAADAAAINTRDLFQSQFSKQISRKFKHCPIALHRNVMELLEVTFAENFAALHKNRFRNPNDLAVSGSLYQHYALMINQAISADITYQYLEVTDRKLPLKMLRLGVMPAWDRPVVVCLNAVTGGDGSPINQRAVQWHLLRLLPSVNQPTQNFLRTEPLHYRLLRLLAWGGRLLEKITSRRH